LQTESGETNAQLIDPITRQPVGNPVVTWVLRGTKGVISRVGVVFFHHLTGCRVDWDLDTRNWCIEYP
jgi:hypothetical protein